MHWRAARAAATPWMKREFAAARAKLLAMPRRDVVIDRDVLDRIVRAAAPPGVPVDAVVLPGSELRARFPDGPDVRRGHHLVGKLRLTHRAIPSEAVLVVALVSDVAADYYVETMAADVATELDRKYGAVPLADAHPGGPVVLKELATAAGPGG